MVVSNRYGSGTAGSKPTAFTQDTFTIPSPFPYDWGFGSRSIIMTNTGSVLADVSASADTIGYGDVPVRASRTFPVRRRPEMYSLVAQDTLEPYTQRQFRTARRDDLRDRGRRSRPEQHALERRAHRRSESGGRRNHRRQDAATHRAPSRLLRIQRPDRVRRAAEILDRRERRSPDPLRRDGESRSEERPDHAGSITYPYVRTHRAVGESIPNRRLGDDYWVVDRDYARVALMQDVDMIPPETALVLAGMGVDVVAVNADSANPVLSALWQSRIADYLHIAVANRQADEGIYLGGYQTFPSFREAAGEVILNMNTADIRTKPTARFFDANSIVRRCSATAGNC